VTPELQNGGPSKCEVAMTAHEYRAAMGWLQVGHTEMAKLLGVDPRTSRRYADGTRPVPQIVKIVIDLRIAVQRSAAPTEAPAVSPGHHKPAPPKVDAVALSTSNGTAAPAAGTAPDRSHESAPEPKRDVNDEPSSPPKQKAPVLGTGPRSGCHQQKDVEHNPISNGFDASPEPLDHRPLDPRVKMRLVSQEKALRELYYMRRKAPGTTIDKPFLEWAAAMKINLEAVYDSAVLGERVGFTVAEDEAFWSIRWRKPHMRNGRRVVTRFPTMVPAGENKKQCKRRRERFKRHAAKQQPDTKPRTTVTRMEALLKALPTRPGATIRAVAIKLRPHQAWRDAAGKMRTFVTIEREIRSMSGEHADLRHDRTGLLWREPFGPRK
jgi:hypothetical protein